jgi:transcriptional regulator with XRE-family HTH domain
MITARSSEQRRALGDFVRAQRERTAPESLGLSPGSRRRTPGLRREELAQLCGLSTTWFTWIEQGRDVSVSPGALARLAGTLRLGRAERTYLFDIAGKRDPDQAADDADALIAPAVLACVETIRSPAYILDRTWTARSWNAKARHLFAGWLDAPGEHRYNLLRFIFLTPSARTLIRDWDARARRVAAEFRAACSAHFNDPALRTLIAELREGSREFAQFWEQHGVLGREGGERTFNHPRDGFVRYRQVTFDLASQPDVKLTLLLAPEKTQRVGTGLSPR